MQKEVLTERDKKKKAWEGIKLTGKSNYSNKFRMLSQYKHEASLYIAFSIMPYGWNSYAL